MFFKKAQHGLNHWWRYIVVILAIMAGYTIGQIPMYLAIGRAIAENTDLTSAALLEFSDNPDFSIFGINRNMGFTLLLVMFLGAFAAFYFIFKAIHQREFRTLITPSSRINWNKIFFGFGIWLFFSLVVEVGAYLMAPEHYTFQFQYNTFIPLVILSVLLLPVQTSMEEFLFRGYLMQGIGNSKLLMNSRFNSKLIPLVISSILFGLIHSMNPEINEFGFGIMQSYYITAGLVLGIMTLMDDGLELALGVHAATNFTGAVFVGYDGAAIQTDALFVTKELNPLYMLFAFIIISILFILLCKYRYNWGSFNKIVSKVEEPSFETV